MQKQKHSGSFTDFTLELFHRSLDDADRASRQVFQCIRRKAAPMIFPPAVVHRDTMRSIALLQVGPFFRIDQVLQSRIHLLKPVVEKNSTS